MTHDDAPEGDPRPAWKPAMTRPEAEAWCADSAYAAPVHHATTIAAAAAIRRHGFDLAYRRIARVWGNGVYAAIDSETSDYYLRQLGEDATLLELRADVRNVLRVRLSVGGRKDPLLQLLAYLSGGLSRFLDASFEEGDRPTGLTRTLTDAGYDALEIVTDRSSAAIGGNQLVVFDPRAIVVVDDDDADRG